MRNIQVSVILHVNDNPYLSVDELGTKAKDFFERLSGLQQDIPCVNLYLCGRFLEAASRKCSAEIGALRQKVRSGDVEILGGGYYDPIFPLLTEFAQNRHIVRLEQSLETFLGVRGRGFWLPSFVWELSLIPMLQGRGYEYTVLKDYQLEQSVSRASKNHGYWTIEDRGKLIRIISSNSELSDLIRIGKPLKAMEKLKLEQYDGPVVLDLPLFRTGRTTYEYQIFDYLHLFCEAASANDIQLSFRSLSNIVDNQSSCGAITLAGSVGKNLGLPSALCSARDLLILQPECNYMHKRMLQLQQSIEELDDEPLQEELQDYLLPAQGIFFYRNQPEIGGVRYLRDRSQNMEFLLLAENKLRSALATKGTKLEVRDFLGSGSKQIVFSGEKFQFLLEHRLGGRLRSLDVRSQKINLINGYRQSLEYQKRIFDVEPVSGWVDHFFDVDDLSAESALELFESRAHILMGNYEYQIKKVAAKTQILLSGEQFLKNTAIGGSLVIEKVLGTSKSASELVFSTSIENPGFNLIKGSFATEFPISFREWNGVDQSVRINGKKTSTSELPQILTDVSEIEILDAVSGVHFKWFLVKPASVYLQPVYSRDTVDDAAEGFQYLRIAAIWSCALLGQEKASFLSRIDIKKRNKIARSLL